MSQVTAVSPPSTFVCPDFCSRVMNRHYAKGVRTDSPVSIHPIAEIRALAAKVGHSLMLEVASNH